ncbi:MAG: hypothetical protein HY728_10590 [Candidatus Rokubacteria bacterium]|nr:hypothetical protein [Candidatus Rokubacteria bacterium]
MLLFIVARNEPRLYATLRQEFAAERGVQVVLDRRGGERRQRHAAQPHERRRQDRRGHAEIDPHLRSIGWAIVRRPEPAA